MNNAKTSTVSGCVIWFLLIAIIGSCVMPVFFLAGTLSSFTDFAVQTMGGWLCPDGTTPEKYTYQTTMSDEYGNPRPATAYELHCVDASGDVVKTDPIAYAFIWVGIIALLGVVLTGVLAFVFAVPGGMLVTRLLNKLRGSRSNSV
ncbi:MAG: hypothetical protein J0L96_03715 [Anaerolineae bacterium]|nr:hypothetical protein [Anaerolineae bacterium]